MNINIRKSSPPPPPPPHFLIRSVLLCFLFLILFLAVPVQSQTPVPTVPPRLTNPTVMGPCGLPASYAEFTSAATVTTFNMTADCVFNSWSVQPFSAFLFFSSGEFIINGNGHSIIGPASSYAITVGNAGTVLNLNDVTIRQAGTETVSVIFVNAGRLNARNLIFRDNNVLQVLSLSSDAQVYLQNVQFLNNRGASTGQVIRLTTTGALLSITNGIFQGNTGFTALIDFTGDVQLQGCITRADGLGNNNAGGAITDSNTGACPAEGFSYWLSLTPSPRKKAEKIPTAAPTSTPRPQIAATHVALQAATGATFRTAFGLDSGVHFRQLDGAGIGIQSIIDAGFLEAFDVYGYVEQGVEVCFPQIGRVIFLDANTSPRAITTLESTVVNGQTCVSIASPGSLVLMPSP